MDNARPLEAIAWDASADAYLRWPASWRHRLRTTNLAEGFFRHLRRDLGRFPGCTDPAHSERILGCFLLASEATHAEHLLRSFSFPVHPPTRF